MAYAQAQAKKSFFESHILPVFLIFLIPGFSVWFFSGAEAHLDREILEQVVTQLGSRNDVDPAEKAQFLKFVSTVPVSRIMASDSPDAVEVQPMFAPASERYTTFRWFKRLAWGCLAIILATFVIVGVSVACSFRSHKAQYYSLRIGWAVLRTSAAIQILGQGALVIALSYWFTAVLMGWYDRNLIIFAGIVAVCAVLMLLCAIFTKVDDQRKVSGALIAENDAPFLWQRVRSMAARLQTAAPDRIIAGVEPGFFVTEHPVILGSLRHEGRTLYVSLPMLKLMALDEADAALGHELAHFSGQDTFWSRKISPLISKFALYLHLLGDGPTRVVAHFIEPFWKLYNLSIRRLGREREFRADRIGAELVSMDAMKRALVKATCYSEYRAEAERSVFKNPRLGQTPDLAHHLERGYPAFLSAFTSFGRAIEQRVPHPFDTHPTLQNRLADLGFNAATALRDAQIQQPVRNPWYEAIVSLPRLEEQMWKHWQEALQSHGAELARRLLPSNAEEADIVRAHFPETVFRRWDGEEVILEFDRVTLSKYDSSILFKDIVDTRVEDTFHGKQLTLTYKKRGRPKPLVTTFNPMGFSGYERDFPTLFDEYFNRHRSAPMRSWKAMRSKLLGQ